MQIETSENNPNALDKNSKLFKYGTWSMISIFINFF